MLKPRPDDAEPLTVDSFIACFADADERYELINGEAVAMGGASIRHSLITTNLIATLYAKLRGTTCRPMGPDTRLKLDTGNIRLPDVAIYCDIANLQTSDDETASAPKIIFEILSPSTRQTDRIHKLMEYQRIPSVDAIVLVDPVRRAIDLYERTGEREWHVLTLIGGVVRLRDPSVEIDFDEIFADVEGHD